MLQYIIAFVALVPPFEPFQRAARQNFAVFFFAQKGVTALVRTGGVAELGVSGFKGSFNELTDPVFDEEAFRNSAGQDVGTDQERHATRVQSFTLRRALSQTERWSWEHRDHV